MKVLIGSSFMVLEKAIPDLQQKFPDFEFAYCSSREELPAMIAEADILLGGVNRGTFLAAKNLKWIQSPVPGSTIT